MRNIILSCSILVSAGLAFAQAPQSKPLSQFEQELVNSQNQFMQALQQKDVRYVQQTVADDFQGIATNGDDYSKEELVGSAEEGVPKDLRVYDVKVIRLNDESAVITYNLIVPGARPRYRHMSDTWAKESGKWKLKFQQFTANLWSAMDFD